MLEFLYLLAGLILGIGSVLIYGVSLILRDTPETPRKAQEKGYNPPPETPNQPTKHQVPPKTDR